MAVRSHGNTPSVSATNRYHTGRGVLHLALEFRLREGDTLVVWKLSRLARSLTQVIKTAADIDDRGIALKVLTQNIDTSTPEGRLLFHMTAAFDEFQRELIAENTRASLAAAAKRGRRGGRPKTMTDTSTAVVWPATANQRSSVSVLRRTQRPRASPRNISCRMESGMGSR